MNVNPEYAEALTVAEVSQQLCTVNAGKLIDLIKQPASHSKRQTPLC